MKLSISDSLSTYKNANFLILSNEFGIQSDPGTNARPDSAQTLPSPPPISFNISMAMNRSILSGVGDSFTENLHSVPVSSLLPESLL